MLRLAPAPLLAVLLIPALAACGESGALKPRSAEATPPTPYGRDRAQTANTMLTPTPQAAPQRSVELHTRSEPRADDPFDLPPTGS